jgi:hypothetical protein
MSRGRVGTRLARLQGEGFAGSQDVDKSRRDFLLTGGGGQRRQLTYSLARVQARCVTVNHSRGRIVPHVLCRSGVGYLNLHLLRGPRGPVDNRVVRLIPVGGDDDAGRCLRRGLPPWHAGRFRAGMPWGELRESRDRLAHLQGRQPLIPGRLHLPETRRRGHDRGRTPDRRQQRCGD